ncbi:MAG TPA: mechanosensitive ion channel domain-containing protein [Candidatus Limnocylindria bacterium]|nr:mechanosensitive ion channel domain-containing protein [Candidatus Limnocylindria bacterium]
MPLDIDVLVDVAVIVAIALVAIWAVRWTIRLAVRGILERPLLPGGGPMDALEFERRVRTLQLLAARIATGVIVLVAGLMAMSRLGIDITPALAGVSVIGIAIGFGAQTLIRDWLAGIFIVLENQYSAGDVVRVAGVEGMVEDFSLRRTTLRDLDGTVHTVPNGHIVVASNLTRGWAAVNVDLTIPSGIDIERGTGVIDGVGRKLAEDPAWRERILEPPRVQRVLDVTEAGAAVKVLGRVRPAEQWAVAGELRKRAYAALADATGTPAAV